MPDITFPNVPALADGGTPSGDTISEDLYKPRFTPEGMEVLNGRLDLDNLKTGVTIGREVVRRKSISDGRQVGATASIDYFTDWFRGQSRGAISGNYPDFPEEAFTVIPGASVAFYLPFDVTAVVLFWGISVINYSGAEEVEEFAGGSPGVRTDFITSGTRPGASIKLFYDDSPIHRVSRVFESGLRYSMIDREEPDDYFPWERKQGFDHRHWTTQVVVDNIAGGGGSLWPVTARSKGWHRADLRICQNMALVSGHSREGEYDEPKTCARVKVRSMGYAYIL